MKPDLEASVIVVGYNGARYLHDCLSSILDQDMPADQYEVIFVDNHSADDSVALVHLANIATRLGRSLQVDGEGETILGDEEATRLLSRQYRDGGHWAIPKGV